MNSLHDEWLSRKAALLKDPRGAFALAKKANSAGEYLLAIEITEGALAEQPGSQNVPLLQQKALALARLGSVESAVETLGQLQAAGAADGETLGLLGRVYKDLAAGAAEPAARRKFLEQSQSYYARGFESTGSTYCGINAASQAVMLGDQQSAEQLASRTLAATQETDPYYALATQAEAFLILKREEEAGSYYAKACSVAGERFADISSTLKQCRDLALKIYGRKDKFDSSFPSGTVAIFAGHIADEAERPAARFPQSCEESVRDRIKRWLAANSVLVSFSSAACGSDLIFLCAAQEAGVETNVVLPFRAENFIESSVRFGDDRWVALFEEVTKKAASITILNDDVADDKSSAYDFTNRMVAAKAKLRSNALGLPAKALAVWNGLPGEGPGGTADAVKCWCGSKIHADSINPMDASADGEVSEETAVAPTPFDRIQTAFPQGYCTAVCAIMHVYFASYAGFHENQFLFFQQKVLGAMARKLATTNYPPVNRCGFGPHYAFVFDAMLPAGMCACELLAAVAVATQAAADPGMEQPRICLHAGPVQLMVNPVLNQYSHEGSTLTRAGRLVQKIPAGAIYATETFAALSALEAVSDFRFEYAGVARYENGDGADRLFSIRQKEAQTSPAKV